MEATAAESRRKCKAGGITERTDQRTDNRQFKRQYITSVGWRDGPRWPWCLCTVIFPTATFPPLPPASPPSRFRLPCASDSWPSKLTLIGQTGVSLTEMRMGDGWRWRYVDRCSFDVYVVCINSFECALLTCAIFSLVISKVIVSLLKRNRFSTSHNRHHCCSCLDRVNVTIYCWGLTDFERHAINIQTSDLLYKSLQIK